MAWNLDIPSAPKDRPILVYCDHSKAPNTKNSDKLTVYEAWCEGEGYIKEPFMCVAKWGGGFNDGEADGGASMPGWWFLHVLGDYLGTPLYPIAWCDLEGLEVLTDPTNKNIL